MKILQIYQKNNLVDQSMADMVEEDMVNTEKVKNNTLPRKSRRDFKNVIKNTEERLNGKRTTKRNTLRKIPKALNVSANTKPNPDSKIVQPTIENTKNLQTFLYLLPLNPSTSKSLPS